MTILIETILSGVVAGGVYGLLGVGVSLTYKTTGIANFAHGQIAILGAYVAWWLTHAHHVPLGLAAAGGVTAAACTSAVMERSVLLPLYGRPLVSPILATFGVAVVLASVTQLLWGSSPQNLPSLASTKAWHVGGVALTPASATIIIVTAVIVIVLVVAVERTRIGRAMRGCAQDAEVVSLLGIPTSRLYLLSFTVAGVTAGVAGVLIAPTIALLPSNGIVLTVPGFAAAILGGLGSLSGAMIAGIMIGIAQNLASVYVTGSYAEAVVYGTIVVVLLIRVRGLFGDELESVRTV